MNTSFKITSLAAAVAIALVSGNAQAINSGTDLNLSTKAKAGAMAGAAYTMPQEASAAVFGNPATLTQFKGNNMNFGASYLGLASVDTEYTGSEQSHSAADNYIVPDVGMTFEVAPGFVLGTGLELDAGLGTNFRSDNAGIPANLPMLIELISFNVNIAGAYQVTEKLSLGAAATIGFGLNQVGTAGSVLPTSSVHDVALGGSLGATYQLLDDVMFSAAYKSEVGYNFEAVLANKGTTPTGFQDNKIEQPAEFIVGVALDNVLADNLLVEADVIWKNWSDAATYEDLFEDQLLVVFGGQYQMDALTLRAGYSWAEEIIRDNPSNTLGDLDISNLLATGAPSTQDVVRLAQMSLVPIIWQHTITVGAGYQLSDAVSLDVYGAYAFAEETSTTYTGPVLGGAVQKTEMDYEFMFGFGISISMP